MPELIVTELSAGYHRAAVLHEASLRVGDSESICVIGANGAGKSTLVRAISGLVPWSRGSISFDGKVLDGRPQRRCAAGIAHVPEGRWVFPDLTVADHLQLGAYTLRSFNRRRRISDIERRVVELFPELGDRARQRAGTLSGGEQQMVAIGRALMSEPRLLILDEPSLGLAPKVVRRIFDTLRELQAQGLSLLLIEQNARVALEICSRAYVLEAGQITLSGQSDELAGGRDVVQRYLGRRPVR